MATVTIELPDLVPALVEALKHPEVRATLGLHGDVDGPLFVTRAAAVRLGAERRVLLRAERAGQLPAFRPGRQTLYRRVDVLALIERHRVEPEARQDAEVVEVDAFERACALARSRMRCGQSR